MTTTELSLRVEENAQPEKSRKWLSRTGSALLNFIVSRTDGGYVFDLPPNARLTEVPTFERTHYSPKDWDYKQTNEGHGGEYLDKFTPFGD